MRFAVQTHLMKRWPSIIALVHFFSFEKPKGLSFNTGCLVSTWQSSFEGSMALLDSQLPILYNTVLESVNHLL